MLADDVVRRLAYGEDAVSHFDLSSILAELSEALLCNTLRSKKSIR
jgi:hypothetical protein